MIDRDAVRNNAKYLRNVRPVDPEEVSEYVEGTPHPAVVRRVLREEAFDLGLVETAEGTFVPVADDPVPRADWAPEALPEPYARTLEDALVDEYGADWHRGESGDELREAIRRLKADYYFGNDVEYDRTAAFGYAVYHLADYYAAVGYVLDALARNGHLPRRLRVLDVGAGISGPALGLHDYLPEDALVDYHAIEPSPAADLLDRFLEGTRTGFHTAIHRTTAEATGFSRAGTDLGRDDEPWDLVVFGNVLSELDEPVPVVRDALDALAPDGSVVALAPADRNTSTGLREIERAVAPPEGDVTVYAPTLRLWPHEAPEDGGWTFATEPDLAVPPFQRRLDEPAAHSPDESPGEFLNVDVQYAYAVLRTDGERLFDVRGDAERYSKMAETERNVTERVNLLAVKLSGDLSAGDNPLFRLGDGSQKVDHYAVVTREDALNRDLTRAPYGAVLALENVLVLWNDDEGAYNLVVDDEVVIDLVAA